MSCASCHISPSTCHLSRMPRATEVQMLVGGKNLGAGAAEERDQGEGMEGEIDHYVLLHHQGVLHLPLLLLLILLLLKYSTEITRLAKDRTQQICRTWKTLSLDNIDRSQNQKKIPRLKILARL